MNRNAHSHIAITR